MMKKKLIIIGVIVALAVLYTIGTGGLDEKEKEPILKGYELWNEEGGVKWYSATLNVDYWDGLSVSNRDTALEIVGQIYKESGVDNLNDFILTAYEENGDQAFMFSDGGYSIQFYKDGNHDADYLLLPEDREELEN